MYRQRFHPRPWKSTGSGHPGNLPLRVWITEILPGKHSLSREAFIIPSARTSSAVSLQLPSLRIFNLLTRCICWVNTWRFPPMTSFQEISSFSKSGREGSKATRSEHKKLHVEFVICSKQDPSTACCSVRG